MRTFSGVAARAVYNELSQMVAGRAVPEQPVVPEASAGEVSMQSPPPRSNFIFSVPDEAEREFDVVGWYHIYSLA